MFFCFIGFKIVVRKAGGGAWLGAGWMQNEGRPQSGAFRYYGVRYSVWDINNRSERTIALQVNYSGGVAL